MKALKIIGLVIATLIFLTLVTGLFIDGKFSVERKITINKPKAEVYDYVKYLKNQNNYSAWAKADPLMKKEFTGEDATVGFISAWESENPDVGKGEQKITGIKEGERIDYELHFIKPFEATNYSYMITEPVSEYQTIVKWGINGEMKYPMNLMTLFMDMEIMLGNDIEKGLSSLKAIMEGYREL